MPDLIVNEKHQPVGTGSPKAVQKVLTIYTVETRVDHGYVLPHSDALAMERT